MQMSSWGCGPGAQQLGAELCCRGEVGHRLALAVLGLPPSSRELSLALCSLPRYAHPRQGCEPVGKWETIVTDGKLKAVPLKSALGRCFPWVVGARAQTERFLGIQKSQNASRGSSFGLPVPRPYSGGLFPAESQGGFPTWLPPRAGGETWHHAQLPQRLLGRRLLPRT